MRWVSLRGVRGRADRGDTCRQEMRADQSPRGLGYSTLRDGARVRGVWSSTTLHQSLSIRRSDNGTMVPYRAYGGSDYWAFQERIFSFTQENIE